MEASRQNSLPQEIILSILFRLPAESVLDCKLVRGAWRDLIRYHANTAYFAYQHLQRQLQEQNHDSDSATVSFVFFDRDNIDRRRGVLYYAEYHEDDEIGNPKFSTKRIKINFGSLEEDSGIVGSCNGLICLSVKTKYQTRDGYWGMDRDPLYICNPITREIVNLPQLSKKPNKVVKIVNGFGYHPLTNEYKVVRICYTLDKPFKGQVEVYTLGSDSGWRYVGETSFNLCSKNTVGSTNAGVWFNGAIHWLDNRRTGIVAFDLVREDFVALPAPTRMLTAYLRVMRGSLCYVDHDVRELTVWFLQKNEEINSSTRQIKLYDERWASTFAITRRGRLLRVGCEEIYLYDLETSTSEKIWQMKSNSTPVSHINSFVSLKALGEKSARKFNESPEHDSLRAKMRGKEIKIRRG